MAICRISRSAFVCLAEVLHPSQRLRLCRDGLFTLPHFFLPKFDLALTSTWGTCFHLYVTTAFLNQWKEDDDHINYFMINLHKSMGPGRDQTRDLWICSRTFMDCATGPGCDICEIGVLA